MKPNRRKRLTRITFVLNGFLFALGGWALIRDEWWLFGACQILAALLNFLMLRTFKQAKFKDQISYAILFLNVVICASNAYLYIQSGTSYIQYAWMLASAFSLVALIVQVIKDRSRAKSKPYV